jgi:hypothetical protein
MSFIDSRSIFCMFFIIGLIAPAYPQENGRRAWIESLVGSVKMRHGNTAKWIDAKPDMPVKPKDAIRTFVESEAVVVTSEGSRVVMGENSTFELSIFIGDSSRHASQTKLTIFNGSIMSDIKKLVTNESRFEFETPTATAAIRGTRVGFDVTSEQTDVKVYEGTVFVTPKGSHDGAEVQSNQMTTVVRGQRRIVVQQFKPQPASPTGSAAPDSIRRRGDTATSTGGATPVAPRDTAVKKDTTSLAPQTDTSATRVSLVLKVAQPSEGAILRPGDPYTVSGMVAPATAQVTVQGKSVAVSPSGAFQLSANAPAQEGMLEIGIEAVLRNQTQSVVRRLSVQEPPKDLILRVITPADNQVVTAPLIHVSGTVTPGAEVVIAGAKVAVGATGSFTKDMPIANEEGAVSVEVEATLGATQQTVRRSVTYTPPREAISLDVKTPVDKQVVCGRLVPMTGSVRPLTGAELAVNGRKVILRSGSFNDMIELPDEPGDQEIEFDLTTDDGSQTLQRMVRYAPAQDRTCNVAPPQLAPSTIPPTSSQNRIVFSVLDATAHDEVTFYTEIDGAAETETGQPGGQFALTLEPGVHQYRVYAEDLVKNRSNVAQGQCAYMNQALAIRMRKPAGSQEVVYLPPAGRPGDEAFEPEYSVVFTIENLPGDDYNLLKEVSVINSQGGGPPAQTRFTDVDFAFGVVLKRGRNDLTIRVQDDLDKVITKTVTIEVK